MQTQRLNLKALESVKEVKWPFYQNVITASGTEKVINDLNASMWESVSFNFIVLS